MSNTTYQPGVGGLPFGLRNTNAQGSFYSGDSEYSPQESNLIQKAIKYAIFDAAPAQFTSLKVLFSKPYKEYGSDEFEYLEHSFGRSPIEAGAGVAAQAANPGNHVTQALVLTNNSLIRVSIDMIIVYPDGSHGVITDITGNTATVNSVVNLGLPAITNGDVFAIQSTLRADGMDTISTYDRLDTITRYNYVQFFLRARRWSTVEYQKYINMGTTDYLDRDRAEKMKQLRIDLFNSFWNGVRGEYTISNGNAAKAMGGIYPLMTSAGSTHLFPTVAGLKATFEAAAFQTNYKAEGGTRFIYGTDETLNYLSEIYKQPTLQYTPDNHIADLRLSMIKVGTMNFVLVPCELWREESCFEASWARRLIILDQETVKPVKMKGIQAFEMGQTGNMTKGRREDFTDYWCKAQLSLEFNNPLASFILDVQ